MCGACSRRRPACSSLACANCCTSGCSTQPRAFLAQQRLVRQRGQHGQRDAADCARRLGRETAVEDRQPRQHLALAIVESTDARTARTRSRCWRDEPAASRRRRAAARHPCRSSLAMACARQHPRPGRGQFQRQRQPLDLSADVDDGCGLGRRSQVRLRRGARRATKRRAASKDSSASRSSSSGHGRPSSGSSHSDASPVARAR